MFLYLVSSEHNPEYTMIIRVYIPTVCSNRSNFTTDMANYGNQQTQRLWTLTSLLLDTLKLVQVHPSAKGNSASLWSTGLWPGKTPLHCHSLQRSSSLPSSQSLSLSHTQRLGMHLPFLHLNWDCSQVGRVFPIMPTNGEMHLEFSYKLPKPIHRWYLNQ